MLYRQHGKTLPQPLLRSTAPPHSYQPSPTTPTPLYKAHSPTTHLEKPLLSHTPPRIRTRHPFHLSRPTRAACRGGNHRSTETP